MVLVVAFLMEPFATVLTYERLHTLVNPHVGVEGRRPVKGLATRATDVRLLGSVNNLVAAQSRRLPETLVAYLLIAFAHRRRIEVNK